MQVKKARSLRLAPTAAVAIFVAWPCLAGLAAGTSVRPWTGSGVSIASATAAPDQTQAEFQAEFLKYRQVGDTTSITKLIRREGFNAQLFALDQLERAATSGSEEINSNLKALRVCWKEAYRSAGFLDKSERYLGGLTPGMRTQRNSQIQGFNNQFNAALEKLAEPAGPERAKVVLDAVKQLESYSQVFDDLGDRYSESRVQYAIGYLSDTQTLGDKYGDLNKVYPAYARFVELRKELELEDEQFKQVAARVEDLKKLGFEPAPEAGGANGGAAPSLGIKFGATRILTTKPALLESPGDLARPNFSSDVAYATWPGLYMTRDGTSASFDAMERSPTVTRTAAAEVEVTGTDGKSQKVALTGRVTRVTTTTGTNPRPWSFFLQTGAQSDYYHDIQVNLLPNAENLNLYVNAAGSMQIDVDGTPVQIFDDNLDGNYGGRPVTRGYSDITKGEFQVDLDCMLVGKGKSAIPFSEYTKIGDGWFRLVAQDGGASYEVTPLETPTGTLELSFKGPIKPEWVVVQGTDLLDGCYFDLTTSKKLEVPIGKYVFLCGGFRDGDRPDGIKKGIFLASKNMPPLVVTPNQNTKFELGAPFSFDFRSTVSGDKVTVLGSSITVVGNGGERYHRLWNTRVQPEILIRKAGSKKGSKGGRMSLIGDAQTLNDKGFDKVWKPLDQDVENKFGNEVEVQLVQDKSKAFGKLESAWVRAE